MKKIAISWTKKNVKANVRVGMMYCFKNCEKNAN